MTLQVEDTRLFKKVLLVEDESAHVLLIKRALKEFSTEIFSASSLQKALEALQKEAPDLIITDLSLPDSRDVSKVLRFKEAAPRIPVIVLTSSTSLRDAVDAIKIGADDYIVKNFDGDFREVLGLSLSRTHVAMALRKEKESLEQKMLSLRSAIENSNDGLAVVNEEGATEYLNSSLAKFIEQCGGSTSALTSICSAKIVNSQQLCKSLQEKLHALPLGAVWQTEVSFVEDKNKAFSLSISAIESSIPTRELSPGGRRSVVWVRDISEQKRREKFQREILSTTTHDLKGPLGAILISSELVLDMFKEQGGKAGELVLRINSSAQNAINLIDEFLSARRIQEGNLILRPKITDVAELMRENFDSFLNVGKSRGVELELLSSEEKLEWPVDKLGLSRAVGNLLSNAIKFTPRGGKVQLALEKRAHELMVKVTDTGSGMEPAEVKKIFERFSRLDKHRDLPGTGLGLFVVKSIVEAHGGKIEVLSQPGKGSSFELLFPLEPPVNERGELIYLGFT